MGARGALFFSLSRLAVASACRPCLYGHADGLHRFVAEDSVPVCLRLGGYIALSKGWNWISIYAEPEDKTVASVLKSAWPTATPMARSMTSADVVLWQTARRQDVSHQGNLLSFSSGGGGLKGRSTDENNYGVYYT